MLNIIQKFGRGVLFTFAIALCSILITRLPGISHWGISPLVAAIVLGLLYGNTLHHKTPASWQAGIIFSQGAILRLGIILFGFRLSFQDMAQVGLVGFAIDAFIVASTLLLGYFIGRKILKINHKTTLLTTMGSAICGAAAIVATTPAVRGRSHHVSIAIATVVIFGTISMFIYPFLIAWLGLDDMQAGIYIGATIHEVAQVVAAGSAVSTETAEVAVVVKLTRVLMLAPAVLAVSLAISWYNKSDTQSKLFIPWFALGFVATAALNSTGWLGTEVIKVFNTLDVLCLSMAMAALGIETNAKKIKNVGAKPFLLAGILCIYLIISGYFLTVFVK